MKRRLFSIFLATLAVGLIGSCAKINEQIADLDKRVETIETQNIVSINTQIESINSSIADLGQIRKDIQDLIGTNTSQNAEIKALQTADENIGKRIDELKAYVGDLSRFAEENWVKNTFATIDELNKTAKELDDLAKTVDGISKNLENLGKTVDGLGKSLEELSGKLSKDIKDASDKLAAQIKSLEDRVSALEQMIQTVTIVPAYTDGSVEAVDDVLTIDCVIEPAAALETLTEKNIFILSSTAKTKAVSIDTIKVAKFGKDIEKGIITIKADVSEAAPASGEALVVAVKIVNGISQYTTEFAPVAIVSTGLPKGSLGGEFSVSSTKKVHFSKSNLYYDGAAFQFEANQFDYVKAWDKSHVGLFYWSKDAAVATAANYSDPQASAGDVLFTNAAEFTINNAVEGFRTLTKQEWVYLTEDRNNAELLCKAGVTVCGNKNCMVIAPDDFKGTISESYNSDEWFMAEEAGLVCLPAAGIRSGSDLAGAEDINTYWTATPTGVGAAGNVVFEAEAEPETKALACAANGEGIAGKEINNNNGNTIFATLGKTNLSPDPKVGSQNVQQSKVSTNGKQQDEQKEIVIKVQDERKDLRVKHTSAKRSAANARNSHPTTNSTSGIKLLGSTNITIGTFSPATYSGEYYVTLTDANSTAQFYFDFDTSVNSFQLGKIYTLDEMMADYVAKGDKNDWYAWESATAATYKETKDEKGLTHIVASMTTESGTYNLTYDQPEPQDINVTAVDWRYDEEYYDVYVASETTTYLFELKNTTDGLTYGTTYTYADMVSSWTGTLYSGYIDTYATDATLTVTKDDAGLIHIAATMVLNGDKHVIAYDEKAFEPSGVKINVNGTDLNGQYFSAYGFYCYMAKWGNYTVQLPFNVTEEKTTYTNDDFNATYGLIYSSDENISLYKLASDITISETDETKTLTGSVYAKNGDEYILNLVYEKPDTKYIDINVKDANLTNKTAAGFWTIDGQTTDKNNSFNIYFISKGLQGTWTDVKKFDSYSTWVSDKSSGSNVYYENISEVNLTSAIVKDSLIVEGTLALADSKGNPAIVTVHISTPFTQTWGEWADFAPFDVNTGKYTFTAVASATQAKVPVQVRKDNTGLKQFKFIGWSKQILTAAGIDLIVDMAPDYSCTVAEQNTGAYQPSYGEYVMVSDMNTYVGSTVYSSTYDPEAGVFKLPVVYYISQGVFGYGYETLTMDKPILQRDTVKVNSSMTIVPEVEKGIIRVSAEDANNRYILEVVGSEIVGKFSLKDGTLSQKYYYGIVSQDGTSRSDFAEGEVVISKNGKRYNLTGLMIGEDEKAYVFDWQGLEGVLDYDTNAPFDAEFVIADASATLKNGVFTINATNAENLAIGLELYIDPAAAEIPAGTYVISDTKEVGTALKSHGIDGGYLTACWAGVRTAQGISDCWFLVEGTVTITYDENGEMSVEVDAKNSWEQNVTARFVPGLDRNYALPIRLVSEAVK